MAIVISLNFNANLIKIFYTVKFRMSIFGVSVKFKM